MFIKVTYLNLLRPFSPLIIMVLLLFFAYFYRMRYVAAYLLAALAGNEAPQAKDIQKILESVGIEADDTRMQKV
jgi:hypothetical protein